MAGGGRRFKRDGGALGWSLCWVAFEGMGYRDGFHGLPCTEVIVISIGVNLAVYCI